MYVWSGLRCLIKRTVCDHYRRSVGKSARPTAVGGQRKTDCGWSPNLSKLRAVCGRSLIVVRHASVNPPTVARDAAAGRNSRTSVVAHKRLTVLTWAGAPVTAAWGL